MNRKVFVVLGIVLLVMVMNAAPNSIEPLQAAPLQIQSIGGDYGEWAYYHLAGDFTRWEPESAWTEFDDTGAYLHLRGILPSPTVKYARFPAPADTNTSVLRYFEFYIGLYVNVWDTGTVGLHIAYIGSSDIVPLHTITGGDVGKWVYFWGNVTLDSLKILGSIKVYLSGNTGIDAVIHVISERYFGYSPTITNYTQVSSSIAPGAATLFTIDGANGSSGTVEIVSEWGGSTSVTLYPAWEKPGRYLNTTTFNYEGFYAYQYFLINSWGVTVNTTAYYFTVSSATYPKYSYLSIFNSIDAFPLPSKDFKIYLGDPDMRECINFRTFYGNWSQLNANGVVNASLITAGWVNNASLVDNYINVTAVENGLKSTFEDAQAYSTITWDTLQFQVEVMQPTWVVIIYNPAFWEKDFYLQFTADMVGYWYDVSIPFINFTEYVDVSNDVLYELGVWVENATALFSNIRVASRYDPVFYNQTYNYTDSQLITRTLTPTQAWTNTSTALFETHFNVSGCAAENVTIPANETVQLNATGNFPAEYSFTDDALGANPAGWTCIEPAGVTIQVVNLAGHSHVAEIDDQSGSNAGQMTQAFAAKTDGTVEFWVRTTDATTVNTYFEIRSGSNYAVYCWIFNDTFRYYSGGTFEIAPAVADTWYHVKFDFDCGVDQFNISIDGIQYGPYNFRNVQTNLDTFYFRTYTTHTGYSIYLDAVDYSWATGYYDGRNRNNTYYGDGVYTSPSYDLGAGDLWLYENFTYFQNLPPDTNLTLQYRVSPDNSSWGSWSAPLTTNVTLEVESDRYIQFCANLSSMGNYTTTPELYWLNLSYTLKNDFWACNHTEGVTFTYNTSSDLLDYGITQLNWSLTVYNETGFNTTLFNFTVDAYQSITAQNYTFQAVSPDFYNLTYFSLQCNASSSSTFNLSFALNLTRGYYETYNCTNYTANSYRLISETNRQNPNELEFNSATETLCIQDFFNNTLFIGDVSYSGFTDIGLPICDITFYNYENYSIVVRIYRGTGTWIELVVPPGSSATVPVFCTNYRVWIADQALRELQVSWVSPNHTRTVIIEWGITQTIVFPDFWQQLWEFLFRTPLGLLFMVVVIVYVIVQTYSALRPRVKLPKPKKRRKLEGGFVI